MKQGSLLIKRTRPSQQTVITESQTKSSPVEDDELRKLRMEKARLELWEFLQASCGSTLRAWLNVFDVDNDQRINKLEFDEGMRKLGYTAKIQQLFADLDDDGSGELTMQEIDPVQASVWTQFRSFCTEHFKSVEGMMEALSSATPDSIEFKRQSLRPSLRHADEITESQFMQNMERMGWSGGSEELLFSALCAEHSGVILASGLRWLSIEFKRLHKKAAAKRKHGLKRQNSDIVMKELFQACATMGFATDAKALWKVLDRDNSGFVSLDELDPKSAEVMAKFKLLIDKKFSSVPDAFAAIDMDGTKKVSATQFDNALKQLGWTGPTKQLFSYLDKDLHKYLQVEDFKFVEKWSPLPFLLVPPNKAAMMELKSLLLHRFGNMLKAWRHLMDKDGDNRVNWDEFLHICKHVGYRGDIAGAWRAFDEDLSGYISLQEVDSDASAFLMDFRNWCHEEFGTVKSAFGVFDEDGSNSLTFEEFRGSCRIYGYIGNYRRLFNSIDIDQQGSLSLKEVAFLDEWEVAKDNDEKQAATESPSARWASRAVDGPHKPMADATKAENENHRWRANIDNIDEPLRLRKVVKVKQQMQQRFDMKLPSMSENRSIEAVGTKAPPLSARTPRHCQERKDRERKQWRIKDPAQRQKFWVSYQQRECADHQEFEAVARESAASPDEELAPVTFDLKPTLDDLLRLPRVVTKRSRVARKGRSQGQRSQSVGNSCMGLPSLPQFGPNEPMVTTLADPMRMTAR
eukprot:TRINITY_DN26838_c0_g1_i2.p1 TRINITY_DN26838_c0_g1~~TRINITY_DN26838_c0_g1_i2.p1  ORF type:complete len:745 (+),score=153.19 TRINITY_DN26838_c0_g1_i2:148-2382(+)